jgi:hypothetical protein
MPKTTAVFIALCCLKKQTRRPRSQVYSCSAYQTFNPSFLAYFPSFSTRSSGNKQSPTFLDTTRVTLKTTVKQFFYCCVCIRYRGNVSTEPLPSNDRGIFTEPLPSNGKGIFTEPLPSKYRGDTQTHTHTHTHSNVIS